MEYRTLEINNLSGRDLNNVNLITKMDVYIVVSISGAGDKNKQKKKTPVDSDGDTNPSWNCPMNFTVDETAANQNRLTLVFKLRCDRTLGDKDIGEVHVPIKELLESSGGAAAEWKQKFVSYQVRKPSGKPKGQLNFSYKFVEKISGPAKVKADHEPVTAYFAAAAAPPMVGTSSPYPPPNPYPPAAGPYPPPKEGGSSGYGPPSVGYPAPAASGYPAPAAAGYPPPPPTGYEYGYGYGYGYPPPPPYGGYPPPPPPAGYGYPPQPGYGYGAPVPVQQPPKKNKFGMGLGAGLLGGALGGLLIGDLFSDAAAYDAGFSDGGFDF
ncbi:hypothetical protein ACH5RR_031129 [Cinchona calisaya]|uniref:C2 domain-containing protein n=1 Tax=Cinchona calisaya TaxID=153742 RepID=A0ABD2YHB7_9GENT